MQKRGRREIHVMIVVLSHPKHDAFLEDPLGAFISLVKTQFFASPKPLRSRQICLEQSIFETFREGGWLKALAESLRSSCFMVRGSPWNKYLGFAALPCSNSLGHRQVGKELASAILRCIGAHSASMFCLGFSLTI